MYNIHMNGPKKALKGDSCTGPRGAVQIEFSQIRWLMGPSDRRLGLVRAGQRLSKTRPAQGGLSGLSPLRSDGFSDGKVGSWTALKVAKDTQRKS
jgi:hypothetical protein